MSDNTHFEPRIVALGGGTGLSNLLRGLKKYTSQITAIVAVTDDGGSSGTLRRELGILPPGDIRNCLVALSEEENLMAQLFQYRFPYAGSLSGHSFGNLFLTAMSALAGGFDMGIARAGEVLAIRGKVLPVTLRSVTLRARLADGRIVRGESNISRSDKRITSLHIHPFPPPAAPQVLEAIAEADAIVLGPGSLYTSIISNLLVEGVAQAVRNSKAPKVYVGNIMTQPGETTGYSLHDHVHAIEKHSGGRFLDHVIINSAPIPAAVARRYARKDSYPVLHGLMERLKKLSVIKADVISSYEYARHDSDKLASAIFRLINKRRSAAI